MANRIKGLTIEIGGDTVKLDKALKGVNGTISKTQAELRDVEKLLKMNPGNTDLIKQKQQMLGAQIKNTKNKLQELKNAQKQMDKNGVDKNSRQYQALQREIIETENKLESLKAEEASMRFYNLEQAGKKMQKVGTAMQTAGRNMTRYVTAPIVGVGAAAVKAGADFDSAMSQVAATSGKTVDEVKDLREFAKKMGSTTKFSATEAAEGLNYMALAGYDAKKSMQMLPTVLDLAAAGGMELADASDMVTDAQSALGLTTKQTKKMVDQMAQTASKSNTSVEQLGSAFLTVGGTAKVMKGGTQELSQVLGLLADNGIKGSEGGTALRNILLSLSSPTDKAAKQLKDLGVNVFDSSGQMRSMKDIMGDLNGAMANMTDEERTKAIATIFNKRDLKSVNALLNTNSGRWDELSASIGNAEGAAKKMADTQLDNLQGQLTLLKSALEGAAISISEVLTPHIRKAVTWVQKWVDNFNKLSDAEKEQKVKMAGVVAAIGPVLLILGKATSGIGTLLTVLPKLSGATKGLGKVLGILTKGPVGLILGAIALVVAGITTLMKTNKGFRDDMMKLFGEIKDAFAPVFETLKKVIPIILDALKPLLPVLMDLLKLVAELFAEIMKEMAPVLAQIIKFVAEVIKAVTPIIKKILEILIPIIKKVATIVVAIVKVIMKVVGAIVKWLVKAITKLAGWLKNAWNGIKNVAKFVWNLIKGFIVNPIKFAIDGVKKAFAAAKEWLKNVWNGIKSIASAVWGGVKRVIINPIKSAIEIVKNVFRAVKDWLKDKWQGIKNVASTVWGGVKRVIINPIKNAIKYVKEVFRAVKDWLSDKWDGIKNVASTAWENIKDAIIGPIKTAWKKVKKFVGWIKDLFDFEGPSVEIGKTSGKNKSGAYVDWHADAMRDGIILNKPTIFGAMNGRLQGGGEAGSEAVIGTKSLASLIQGAVNSALNTDKIASAVREGAYEGTSNITITLDGRILGRELGKLGVQFK